MATMEDTVSFAFPMTTALVADATVTNLTQITLYLPSTPIAFTSVYVKVGFQDVVTATGGTVTEHRCGLRLGAAGYTTVTETDDLVNSGENLGGVIGPFDFTSHFTTNWTGTSMTCDLQVYFDQSTGTTLGMNNVTAEIFISYTFDDTAATQIKTVNIPFESRLGALPTVANSSFGTNQIPQLTGAGGMLVENSPVIRDWYILIEGNECNNATTTDFTLSANIDAGGSTSFMIQEAALGSDRYLRWIYKPAVPTTTAVHDFQLWASVANKCHHITATLVVTYEFTLAGTTEWLTSILVPYEVGSPLGSTTSGDASRFQRNIFTVEPGTITLKQSGFRTHFHCNGGVTTLNFRTGAQAYRTYSSAGSVICGSFALQHRIDTGSAGGAGMTLARGKNTITIDGYSTGGIVATNISGYIMLNYTSDFDSTNGRGVHQNTRLRSRFNWDALGNFNNRVAGASFSIPPAEYWLTAAGFCLIAWQSSLAGAFSVDIELQSGEGKGAGYSDIYTDGIMGDSELSCCEIWMRGRDVFKRFPGDADKDRADIETARDYRIFATANYAKGLIQFVTYHGFTWSVAGNISGHDAGLPTELRLMWDKTATGEPDECMQITTLTAGTTAFNFTVYDDTELYYVVAYQDGTHLGRSDSDTAV